MQYTYTPQGVCSKQIVIDIDDATDTVKSVKIVGGCPGNTVGVSKLCEGKKVDEIIETLKGIQCGYRGTSCPDQLAKALEEIKNAK